MRKIGEKQHLLEKRLGKSMKRDQVMESNRISEPKEGKYP